MAQRQTADGRRRGGFGIGRSEEVRESIGAADGAARFGAEWTLPMFAFAVQRLRHTDGELTAETVALRVLPRALASPEAQAKLFQQAGQAGVGDPFAGHWIELGQVAIQPGQTHELELRLPAR